MVEAGCAAARFCRVLRHNRGVAALEFALGGSIFILLLCMVIELDLILFTQSVLDNAARDAARLIRTGQIQRAGGAPGPFLAKICGDTATLVACGKIQYAVQSAASFSALNATVTTNGRGTMTNNGTFNPGTPGQDVLVQVAYYRQTFLPWAATYLGTNNLLVATVAFQNDPY